jgi:LPS-assembly protein
MVNLLLGAEYDAGCWVGRVAIERNQNSTTSATNRLFFQLELTGFGSVGSGSIATLRDNIPDYSALGQQVVSPSRFENYE